MVMPMHQPVPPPRRRTLRTAVIIIGVVLVLCAGAVTGGYLFFRGIQQATGPARQTTDEFVADLESGNADAAYGRLCASTTSKFTHEEFVQGLNGQPAIRSHQIMGVNVSNVNGRVSATVTTNLTLDNGFTDRHTFTLVKENGQWRVCGQPF